jgi:hypothetical protein
MIKRRVGEVDEDTLAITQGGNPHKRAYSFDVSAGLADETAYVTVSQLDLDRYGAATSLE